MAASSTVVFPIIELFPFITAAADRDRQAYSEQSVAPSKVPEMFRQKQQVVCAQPKAAASFAKLSNLCLFAEMVQRHPQIFRLLLVARPWSKEQVLYSRMLCSA